MVFRRVKVITGIRRCGKSFLLFNIYKKYLLENGISEKQIIEVVLDNIENIKYRDPFKLNEYIKSKIVDDKQYYVFIDEIQFCSSVKNSYIDNDEKKNYFYWHLTFFYEKKKSWYLCYGE